MVAGTTILMSFFTAPLTQLLSGDTIRKLVDLIDAIGTPAFAVVGMQMAEDRGLPLVGIVFIGVVNGVAGGLLRDALVGEVPSLLRPGQFGSLVLVLVCTQFVLLTHYYRVGPTGAAWIAVATFFLIRALVVRYNWRTQPIGSGAAFRFDRDEPADRPSKTER
jgi:uncharacterized membrane protein YeiH